MSSRDKPPPDAPPSGDGEAPADTAGDLDELDALDVLTALVEQTVQASDAHDFIVPTGRQTLTGRLFLPRQARGLVVIVDKGGFAEPPALEETHTTQSAPQSTNLSDADRAALVPALAAANLASLRIALLDPNERAAHGSLPLLSERLLDVLGRIRRTLVPEATPFGSVGIIASDELTPVALRAAAERDADVRALLFFGGFPDLAGLDHLRLLRASVLFLADASDTLAIDNARSAFARAINSRQEIALRRADHLAQAVAWLAQTLAPPGNPR